MFARYASAISTGTCMTFALLFIMQSLITLQPGVQVETRPRHLLMPVPRIEEKPPKTIENIPPIEKLTRTEQPPARPQRTTSQTTVGVPLPTPVAPTNGKEIPGPGLYNDGPLVALVRVSPVYPTRALSQGLEGTVLVQFDVTANGQVVNVVVVESSNSLFERPAIQAAERFKFKPRVIDGVALDSYGIRNLFRFALDAQ